jgi:hypothetical protein
MPNKHQTVIQTISSSEMQIFPTGQVDGALSIPNRQVVLEWPVSMRIGEDEVITLIFEPVVTEPVSSDHSVGNSDVYSHYNLMAEARYEVSGVSVTPTNPIRESMPPRQPVKFSWKVNAANEGSYSGTMWLSLRYLPLDGAPPSQVPIYIQQVTLEASSLFRLNETKAYLLGGVGIVLAAAIVYDNFIAWVLNRKIKKTSKDTMDTKDSL